MRLPVQDEERRTEAVEYLIDQVHDLIDETMEERGVTRSELARKMGVAVPTISKRLLPGHNMTLATLAAVADALGYEVEFALVRHGTPREAE